MIKLNGGIGKPYADQYKPQLGQWMNPSSCRDSNGTEIGFSISGGFYLQSNISDGSYMIIPLFSVGGETKLDILWYRASDRGIFDVYVNGVLDSSGYDGYSASPSNTSTTITLTRSLNPGWNIFKLLVNGKNASASGYGLSVLGARLI